MTKYINNSTVKYNGFGEVVESQTRYTNGSTVIIGSYSRSNDYIYIDATK